MKGFNKKSILCLVVVLVMLVLCFSGCSPEEPPAPSAATEKGPVEGGVLNLAAYPPDTFNPLCTEYSSIRDYLYLVYEGLFIVKDNLTVKGVLAESYEAKDDNRVFNIKLKKGVKFHDGSKFTSQDVCDTLNYLAIYETQYKDVLNNIESYSANGDYQITIRLKSSQANFPANLDFPILSSGLTMEDFIMPNTTYKMNGTGRYKYKETNEYVNLILEKNPSWHGKTKVYIPKVCIRYVNDNDAIAYAFDSGETDIVTTERGRWGEFSYTVNHKSYEITTTKYMFVGINTKDSIFSDVELRRSLASLVDKKNIIDTIMFSHASIADTPISSKAFFYRNNGDADKVEAKKFDASKKLSTYIMYNEESRLKEDIALYLKTVLENAGVKVEITKVNYETYVEKIAKGDYHIYIGEIDMNRDCNLRFMFDVAKVPGVPPGEDVVVKLDEESSDEAKPAEKEEGETTGNILICNFTSTALDDIIANINSAKDDETKKVTYNNLRILYRDEVPQIPLFHTNDAVLVSTRIKGKVNPNLTNFYADLGEIYIPQK